MISSIADEHRADRFDAARDRREHGTTADRCGDAETEADNERDEDECGQCGSSGRHIPTYRQTTRRSTTGQLDTQRLDERINIAFGVEQMCRDALSIEPNPRHDLHVHLMVDVQPLP